MDIKDKGLHLIIENEYGDNIVINCASGKFLFHDYNGHITIVVRRSKEVDDELKDFKAR